MTRLGLLSLLTLRRCVADNHCTCGRGNEVCCFSSRWSCRPGWRRCDAWAPVFLMQEIYNIIAQFVNLLRIYRINVKPVKTCFSSILAIFSREMICLSGLTWKFWFTSITNCYLETFFFCIKSFQSSLPGFHSFEFLFCRWRSILF